MSFPCSDTWCLFSAFWVRIYNLGHFTLWFLPIIFFNHQNFGDLLHFYIDFLLTMLLSMHGLCGNSTELYWIHRESKVPESIWFNSALTATVYFVIIIIIENGKKRHWISIHLPFQMIFCFFHHRMSRNVWSKNTLYRYVMKWLHQMESNNENKKTQFKLKWMYLCTCLHCMHILYIKQQQSSKNYCYKNISLNWPLVVKWIEGTPKKGEPNTYNFIHYYSANLYNTHAKCKTL